MPQPRITAPTAPTAPRLRLSPYRGARSAQLDGQQLRVKGGEVLPAPDYIRWREFYQFLLRHWEPGEHMSLVGQTGSGKTTAMRELLWIRDYVVIIGIKHEDDSLYEPLKKQGWLITDKFDARDWDIENEPRVVYKCPLTDTTLAAEARQREQIRQVLRGVYITGGWCIAIDEVGYLTKDLKLDREMNALWREGRSAGTTVVAGTQRPVNVPRNMWEMATHNVDFKISGKEDRLTATSYLGAMQELAFETLARLDKHEFLYVDSVEDIAVRSKVELGRK